MVLTDAQITAFFEDDSQMVITEVTGIQLHQEGSNKPINIVEFDKDIFKQVANNLRHPGGRIPDPDPNSDTGATIMMTPFIFLANSYIPILTACNMLHYYD